MLKTPSDGRARKYKVWGELHSNIFSGECVEPYVISSLLYRKTSEWLRGSTYYNGADETERIIAKRGGFHVARIASYLWRGNDEWKISRDALKAEIKLIEKEPSQFDIYFDDAFNILIGIMKGTEMYVGDPDRALKSAALDRDIDAYLYKKRQPPKKARSSKRKANN